MGFSRRHQYMLLWFQRGAPIAWMLFIFWLSSQPSLPSAPEPWQDIILKKTGHVLLYGILAILWWRALMTTHVEAVQAFYVAFLMTTAYAITDEIHQTYVPGRHGRPLDVFIDVVGATLTLTFQKWRIERAEKVGKSPR